MQSTKQGTKLRFWPTPQDFNEAVQNLHINVSDPELMSGMVDTGPLGLPRPITGAFASVYKVRAAGHDWALRCFLRDIPDTQWRYGRIADYLRQRKLDYTVTFDFQFQGIQIANRWFPVLKMEWVEGQTLDAYVSDNREPQAMSELSNRFLKMCRDLREAGIAHGDLQHGNIMVRDRELVLVDYDGMFVPHINAPHSNELGHRNYQHPRRNASHFGDYLDNFSAWVIYTSLQALAIDAALYERLGAGEDCLLFRREDFTDPLQSCAFGVLEKHDNERLRQLARFLRGQLFVAPNLVPPLDEEIPALSQELPELPADVPMTRQAAAERKALAVPAPDEADGGRDVWEADNDYKDYLQEADYLALKQAGIPLLHQPPPAALPAPVKIPNSLFKPAPRKVKLQVAQGDISPLLKQVGLILLMVPLGLMVGYNVLHLGGTTGFLLLLAYFLVISLRIWWQPLQHRLIVTHGIPVRGRVTNRTIRYWQTPGANKESPAVLRHSCEVTYEYPRHINGKIERVQAKVTLPDEQFRELQDDEEIVVVYTRTGKSVIYKFSWFQAA